MTRVVPRLVVIVLLGGTVLLSCGPSGLAPSTGDGNRGEDAALLEMMERRVAQSIAQVRESAVALEYTAADAPAKPKARRVATGVVVNDQGDVLSVRIDPPPAAASIVARDVAGHCHPATWVAADPETGLTLLRIDSQVAEPVRPAAEAPQLGSQVLVIGNPFGLGHSVSRGQIAALDRRLDVGPRPIGGLIQVDTALHPGDNGALVANLQGEWLGLVRSGLTLPEASHVPDHDLGFAIPAHDALWVADQLRTRHQVDRAYLGVRLDLGGTGDRPGAVLDDVLDDTPAAQAGLRPGDRVVALNGHAIDSPGDLTDRLDRTLAHAEVTIDYLRGTNREHLTLQTVSRPPIAPAPPNPPPKLDEPRPPLPPAVLDRIERLERRIQELEREKQVSSGPPP